MKINFFSVYLLVFIVSGNSAVKNECNKETVIIIKNDTLTKKTKCYKDGGWEVINKRNGKLDGEIHSYYPNGQSMSISFFKNGKQIGIQKGFNADGFPAVYKPYFNGLPVDTHKVYFDNKKPEKIIIYDSTGQQNGWCKKWYETTGMLSDSTLYSHGDKLQEFLFYSSGKPMFSSALKADGYIISSVAFYPDGKKSGEVKNGNGRVIIPRHADRTDFYDTLTIVNGKVQNAEHEFFKDR